MYGKRNGGRLEGGVFRKGRNYKERDGRKMRMGGSENRIDGCRE